MTESYIIIIIVAKVRLLLTMILADIFPGSIKIMGVVFRFSKQQKFFDNGLHPHIISVTEILSILMDYWHFKTTERESFIFFFIEKKNSTVSKKFGSWNIIMQNCKKAISSQNNADGMLSSSKAATKYFYWCTSRLSKFWTKEWIEVGKHGYFFFLIYSFITTQGKISPKIEENPCSNSQEWPKNSV